VAKNNTFAPLLNFKTMSKLFIKFFDKIIIVLLGFSGMVTACKKLPTDCNANYFSGYIPSDSLVIMYGVIASDFEIRGKVTHKANSKPISGIRIIQKQSENMGDTIYTNSEGNYFYRYIGYLPYNDEGEQVCHFIFEDIDGEDNGGNFATKEMNVLINEKDKTESCGEGWPSVRYEKTQNIKLDKK
jgi:putative lipoprotein (rSAM/lipoprotein system)